jgi:hypothetical protein
MTVQGQEEIGYVTTRKFRIIEWMSKFEDGSCKVQYELQSQDGQRGWKSLGMSPTLADARMALILRTPDTGCWLG